MIFPLETQKAHRFLRRLAADPRFSGAARSIFYILMGLIFSAASLGGYALPLSLCILLSCPRGPGILSFCGGVLGYHLFWGQAGIPGILSLIIGLPVSLLFSENPMPRQKPYFLPMLSAFCVAFSGVILQFLTGDPTPIPVYLLGIAISFCGTLLFLQLRFHRTAVTDWLCIGLLVLSLAQIAPISYLNLGLIAAGFFFGSVTFPATVLSGLALDLAGISPVPFSAVLTLAYSVRFFPKLPKWLSALALFLSYMGISLLWHAYDLRSFIPLMAGGLVGIYLPQNRRFLYRRGETGMAQVRLELAAGTLNQAEDLLRETQPTPPDEGSLMLRAAQDACKACPCRKSCRDSQQLLEIPPKILHQPLLSVEELPVICRKPGRYLMELHRCQEQLRSIRATRELQKEYRLAVIQQYHFLSEFLHSLSDTLPQRAESSERVFSPEVTVCGNRARYQNGDQVRHFTGIGHNYYVLLCDGMGTGPGAVQEGNSAASMLRKLLAAGFSPEQALGSLNSICALGDKAGIVSVDLAEISLQTGKATLYKWGAPPSYLVTPYGAEKIGTGGPPPGLSVSELPGEALSLSIKKGQWLVMVSDGVGQREALRCCTELGDGSPKDLAATILSCGNLLSKSDDATVAVIRLKKHI